MEAPGGSFEITVVNLGTSRQEFAVVSLFDGDPGALPMLNGTLDVSRDGLSFDSENPATTTFYVVHPDLESREGTDMASGILVPDSVGPGEEKTVTIGSLMGGGEPGTYLVLSYAPGRYEAGDYVAFTITD